MSNPKDILGIDPSGALVRPIDWRDYTIGANELGGAGEPFNWDKGYDVEKELETAVGGDFKLPTKDQGSSSSCGGQTIAEYGQAITTLFLKDTSEKSAKAPYSQVFVPQGGSNARKIGGIYIKQGIYAEALVPSYINGKPPIESFMTRPEDISEEARTDAKKTAGLLAYAFPALNIDAVAGAIRDYKGLLLGISGSNNGTWLTSHPSPEQEGALWHHFMYAGKAEIIDGVKGIWAKQSWGKKCAKETDAWQFISEAHFTQHRVWEAMAFIYSEKPPATNHVFNVTIKYGETSKEVTELQTVLAREGVFNLAPTGYYGDITAKSVLKFRAKYNVDSSTDPLGRSVGPRTRQALNALPAT